MSERAPAFRLSSDDGTTTTLKSYAGRYLVLFFYPKDDTPGCTREAQAFSGLSKHFTKLGATVVGVSRDSLEQHRKFKQKYGLQIPLLSDPERVAHEAYGVWAEKKLYGKVSMGTVRSTFLIDPAGKIAKRYSNVKVDGHAETVLEDLQMLLQGAEAQVAKPAAKPAAKSATPATKSKKPAAKGASSVKRVAKPTTNPARKASKKA